MDATEEVDGEHLRVSGLKRIQRATSRREVEEEPRGSIHPASSLDLFRKD